MKSACILLVSALVLTACARPRAASGPETVVYTSTREVTGLAVGPDGTLWAATTGGVLRRAPDGTWRKWTRMDGLPSHEARSVNMNGKVATVRFPAASAAWRDDRWEVTSAMPPSAPEPPSARWRGAKWTAILAGLVRGEGATARSYPLPPSPGTHISALLPRGSSLWAALYGDGLWAFDGERWTRLDVDLPEQAREVTALAAQGKDVWLGTRREGLWRYDGARWTGYLSPDEPLAHNIQALASFRGVLYASTLEDGLVVRPRAGWERPPAGALSSNAPRQMVVFERTLYIRHGGGQVDAFDGGTWERDVFRTLPRKRVAAIAADGERLYLAQWGGWSEWDGKEFAHHLRLPDLQGTAITALLPDGDTLWIGIQGKGLAAVDRAAGKVQWHDARNGLTDDWVTALARVGPDVFAGTFVGGLNRWAGSQWHEYPALAGRNVTALEPDNRGGLYIGTRSGLYHASPSGLRRLNDDYPWLDTEVQAICLHDGALWIATRTGMERLGT